MPPTKIETLRVVSKITGDRYYTLWGGVTKAYERKSVSCGMISRPRFNEKAPIYPYPARVHGKRSENLAINRNSSSEETLLT